LGKRITAKVVLSRLNAGHLVETIQLAATCGVSTTCFAFPHPMGNARLLFDKVVPTYSDIKQEIEEVVQLAKVRNWQFSLETFPLCVVGEHFAYVAELAETFSDQVLYHPVGESEGNWSEDYQNSKRKFPQCSECILEASCEGPWREYSDVFGSDEFKPISFDERMVEDFIVTTVRLQNRNKFSKALPPPGVNLK